MNPTPEQGAVINQAVEWHQRLKQGELDQAAQREFDAWLRQSPEHAKELVGLNLIDAMLRGRSFKKNISRALPENVVAFESYAPATRPRAQEPQMQSVAPRFNAKVAAAACLVLAVVVMFLASLVSTDQAIVTHEGRWDKQMLADGSVVYVGPRTKLRFHFDDEQRRITLARGEALFEVAKDPDRPFIVSTNAGTVRAIGTEFATRDMGDTVLVTVAEGKVAVAALTGGSDAQAAVRVIANQQVVLAPTGVSAPVAVNAARELKWVRNWYEFDGEPVGEIVAQLNLRHDAQIIVDDPQVTRARINPLSFKPSEPQEFVAKINGWYSGRPRAKGSVGKDVLHLERP